MDGVTGAVPSGPIRSYAQSSGVAGTLAAGHLPNEHEPKISVVEMVLIGIYAAVLDIADIFGGGDLVIVDFFGLGIDFYCYMKGLPMTRMMLGTLAAWIPGLDNFDCGYSIGWWLTVYADRHPASEKILQVASTIAGRPGAGTAGAGVLQKLEGGGTPGLLRSVPGEAATGLQPRVAGKALPAIGAAGERTAEGAAKFETGAPGKIREWRGKLETKSQERMKQVGGSYDQTPRGPSAGEEEPVEGEIIPGERSYFETPALIEEAAAPKPYTMGELPTKEPSRKEQPTTGALEKETPTPSSRTTSEDFALSGAQVMQTPKESSLPSEAAPVPETPAAVPPPEPSPQPTPTPTPVTAVAAEPAAPSPVIISSAPSPSETPAQNIPEAAAPLPEAISPSQPASAPEPAPLEFQIPEPAAPEPITLQVPEPAPSVPLPAEPIPPPPTAAPRPTFRRVPEPPSRHPAAAPAASTRRKPTPDEEELLRELFETPVIDTVATPLEHELDRAAGKTSGKDTVPLPPDQQQRRGPGLAQNPPKK